MKAIANITNTATLHLVDRPEPVITADDDIKLRVLRVGNLRDGPGGSCRGPFQGLRWVKMNW